MFGWLKKRILNASVDSMRDDITRFIYGLQGADDSDLAYMLVVAQSLRLKLIRNQVIPPAALDYGIERTESISIKCSVCSIALAKMVQQFQKDGQRTNAFGCMVWLHSVRCLNNPELRSLGRELWGELSRGFPHINEAINTLQSAIDEPLGNEVLFIPVGLEFR